MHQRHRRHRHEWATVKGTRFRELRIWWVMVRRMGWKVLIRHPHHYVVAFMLSGAVIYFGRHDIEAHALPWLYALLDNLTTVAEE